MSTAAEAAPLTSIAVVIGARKAKAASLEDKRALLDALRTELAAYQERQLSSAASLEGAEHAYAEVSALAIATGAKRPPLPERLRDLRDDQDSLACLVDSCAAEIAAYAEEVRTLERRDRDREDRLHSAQMSHARWEREIQDLRRKLKQIEENRADCRRMILNNGGTDPEVITDENR